MSAPCTTPLEQVTSIKLKLGLLVAVSVVVAAVLGTVSGRAASRRGWRSR